MEYLSDRRMLRRVHYWGFILATVLAPLPFGSNRPVAWAVLSGWIGFLCLTWSLVQFRDRTAPRPILDEILGPAALFALALGWGFAQSLPWLPASLQHPAWSQVAESGTTGAVALDPYAARGALLRLGGYGAAFWLALQHCRSTRRARVLVESLAVAGGLYAFYGLVVYATGTETILWYRKWAYEGFLTSTFVNRNSYAAFAGISLLCSLAAVSLRLQHRRPGWVALLLHLQRPTAAYGLIAVAVLVSLLASGSRAGAGATLIGVGGFLLALWVGRNRRPTAAIAALAGYGLAVGSAVAFLFLSETFASAGSDRHQVYKIALQAIADRPWTGSGLGSFAAELQLRRPPDLAQIWTEAHNTYLELAVELGIPAAACLLAGIGLLVARCLGAILHGTAPTALPALAVAASLLLGVHVMVDFSVQMPAIALIWSALLGMGVSQAVGPARRLRPPLTAQLTRADTA